MWHQPSSTTIKHAIVSGRAYPNLVKGANTTRRVTASQRDSEAFYRDDAIRLSDADMADINGAIGAPLCFEHNKKDIVGKVTHSWVDEGAGRYMHITARIPQTERGKKIAEQIRSGEITGFSVGYGAELAVEASRSVKGKNFYEISLVREPFFDGCRLTVGVMASAASAAASEVVEQGGYLYAPFQMASEIPSTNNAAADVASPAAASPLMPAGSQNAAAESLLKQSDILARDLENERKEKATMAARLAAFERKEQQEAESYKQAQLPKAEEYMRGLEEQIGKPLSEQEKQQYVAAFTLPAYKADAERLMLQHQNHVKITASRSKELEELNALRQEKAKMSELLAKAANNVGNMRANFAEVVASKDAAAAAAAGAPKDERRNVADAASVGELAEIMCSRPSAAEEHFIKKLGFLGGEVGPYGEVQVNASRANHLRSSVLPAREHNQLVNEHGDLNFDQSARYLQPTVFGWLANHSKLLDRNVNLDGYARMSNDHNKIDETRRVDV